MATRAEHLDVAEHSGVAEHLDVVIVGAGLSGVGAACHLSTSVPEKSFALLEARERGNVSAIGWDSRLPRSARPSRSLRVR